MDSSRSTNAAWAASSGVPKRINANSYAQSNSNCWNVVSFAKLIWFKASNNRGCKPEGPWWASATAAVICVSGSLAENTRSCHISTG